MIQLVICSVGTSWGRGYILTFLFYSQWPSLPSPLICLKMIEDFSGWKKHPALHKLLREGGAISAQRVLRLPSQWCCQVCRKLDSSCASSSHNLHLNLHCARKKSLPVLGWALFFVFGYVEKLENYMDNVVAQCCPFPQLWSMRCAGLCWEFSPLAFEPCLRFIGEGWKSWHLEHSSACCLFPSGTFDLKDLDAFLY